MRRSAAVLILGVAILAGACSSDDDGGSAANTSIPDPTTTASTTTEPRTVAPDIIPADVSQIDEAYVEGVVVALYRVSGDAIRDAVKNDGMDERTLDLLSAVHGVQAAADQINFLADAETDGFDKYVPEPGYVEVTVVDVVEADESCVIAEIEVDPSDVLVSPPDRTGVRSFLRLAPASAEQLAGGLNPTAWVIEESDITFDGEPGTLTCD